ncbi:MAG: LD-carboxypeptidase [Proteobacteria bacterium]|nr:LD-carboxypeptidase [Pseudomonadota bacterium]
MPNKLIKPKALHPASQIGIVSPARLATPDVIEIGKSFLQNMGFSVFVHPQNTEKHFQLAGTDEDRAQAIMDMVEDPSIDAILAPRGGIGSYRVIPHLKFDVIAENPKIFCGFSDLTTLMLAIHQRTGLVTFHGPLLMNLSGDHDAYNLNFLTQFLTGKIPTGQPIHYPEGRCMREGKAEGKIIGGNITLLQHMIATKDEIDMSSAILFLEDDAGEKISDIERKLWHFKNTGKLQRIGALIVGEFAGFREDSNGEWGRDILAILKEVLPSHVPVVWNFPCGHGKKMTTLPLGITARIEISPKGTYLTYTESPFA